MKADLATECGARVGETDSRAVQGKRSRTSEGLRGNEQMSSNALLDLV
jgi:hypothetical protein